MEEVNDNDIVNRTMTVRNGLRSLKNDHYEILGRLREDYENRRNANVVDDSTMLETRLKTVNQSLEQLEIGIAESNVLIGLSEHFNRIESERSVMRLEMSRISDENDWLREELTDTQRKLEDAYAEIAELQAERRKYEFQEELRNISESNVRPITPSKIPVGAWRVEEEKAINNALDKTPRSASPAPSRLPVGAWRTKVSTYKNVMERKEIKEKAESNERNKRSYFKLNAAAPTSKIPSR